MATKSTHSGHCQACGHLQKLPGGVLAKHGYTVTHGFFSGVCQGAGYLPYEQSCDLIKTFIARAEARRTVLVAKRARWQAPATEAKAWVAVYLPATWDRRYSSHQWRYLPITFSPYAHAPERGRFVYPAQEEGVGGRGEHNREIGSGEAAGLLSAATAANAKYAGWIGREIAELDRYIAWQQRRVAEWTLTDLLPNTAKKDKAGFVPELTGSEQAEAV